MLGWKQSSRKTSPISVNTVSDPLGGPLPPIPLDNELQHFRRVQVLEPAEPVRDMDEAVSRLAADCTDAAANAFVGLHHFIEWTESDHLGTGLSEAERHLKLAVKSGNLLTFSTTTYLVDKRHHVANVLLILDPFAFEPLYLLARVSIAGGDFVQSYAFLQQAIYRAPNVPELWTTVGRLFYAIHQSRDSLNYIAESVRLNPFLWINWHNLGVLVRNILDMAI